MKGLHALSSSRTCLMISYESLKTLSSEISSSLVNFNLVMSALYSTSLLKARKVKQRAYSIAAPFRLVRMTPAPLAKGVDDPST